MGLKEQMEEIKIALEKSSIVSLGKQCKNEFIQYKFIMDADNKNIYSITKEYYNDSSRSIDKLKNKSETIINKSMGTVLNNDIYDLLMKGYEYLR